MTSPTAFPTLSPTITAFSEALTYTNTTTEGVFGIAVVLTFWLFAFFAFSTAPVEKRFAASSFLSMLLSIFMLVGDMVSLYVTGFFIGLTGLSVLFLLVKRPDGYG